MRPQQEMNYGGMGPDRPGSTYSGYEGLPSPLHQREKLSGQIASQAPTAGQRLALAIVSLAMFLLLTFGLIGMAIATEASPWVIMPILLILCLFTTIAAIINIVFNRKS